MIKKWTLNIKYRAHAKDDIVKRHERFLESLKGVGAPWEIPVNKATQANPVPAGKLIEVIQLGSVLPKKMKGHITYQVRVEPYINDKDDILTIYFHLNDVDFEDLSLHVFEQYISAFTAYRAEILTNEITDRMTQDHEKSREIFWASQKSLHGRDGVYRIPPIAFYDRELCFRAFNLTPDEIVNRLTGNVEKVYLHEDGVIIIYSSEPVDEETYYRIDSELRPLLEKKKIFGIF